ncbi:MAG: group III truncated hemoglobin [Chitinophagaceae bacterium]|nr:group III truncated hemoglobin [Chitinophagaceae bacterium]
MRKDIETRADIEQVIRIFYEKLLADERIAYLFTEIAKIDLSTHLPRLCDFWESIIFDKNDYAKNVMTLHTHLHQQSPLTAEHFKIWLHYFFETVDQYHEGILAQKMKDRANGIAYIMKTKTLNV